MDLSILPISMNNSAIEFIAKRIACDDYLGLCSLSCNYYEIDDVKFILKLLDKHAPNRTLMKILTTDISKHPVNNPDENIFAQLCLEVISQIHKGTQGTMRKNCFVDFRRMGFIAMYNKDKDLIDPVKSGDFEYISLTKQGQKLINPINSEERFFIFSKGIDSQLDGHVNLLLEFFNNADNKIDYITIYEYMFFVSAIHTKTAFTIDIQKCVEYINLYRTLSRGQQNAVVKTLKEKMRPQNCSGNKTDKRDFHNWWNKAKQLFSVITRTVYFEKRGSKLVLREM
jgi:hypothetical protein